MLEAQERLGLAITFLLFEKGAQREASMVPDDRGGTERDLAAGLLDPPAKINVIASLVIFRIESADVLKRPAIPRHVTTGNVLGDSVGKQHMARPARRRCHTSLNPMLRWRRDIRPTDACEIAAQQRAY